jgi:hypothetical protein
MFRSIAVRFHATCFALSIASPLLVAACSDDADTPDVDDAGDARDAGETAAAGKAGRASAAGSGATAGSAGRGAAAGAGGSSANAGGGGHAGTPESKPDAGSPIHLEPVQLGAASEYAMLAKSAVTNVPTSKITGDIGLSPAAASYITGFALTKAGEKWTSPEVTGSIFAADNDPPTPNNLTTAVADMQTAYTDAAGRTTPTFLDLGAGAIGGMTLAPGLYKWSSSVTIPADIAISGGAEDLWIFQITGDLKLAAAKAMTLRGGAQAKNIVWQVAGHVDLGSMSHSEGVVLSKTAITLGSGASIDGRLLAQTAINIGNSTVTAP